MNCGARRWDGLGCRDGDRVHADLRPYAELPEPERETYRATARCVLGMDAPAPRPPARSP